MRIALVLVSMLTTFLATCQAQDTVSLFDPAKDAYGWTFANGPEFKGATGGLAIDDAVKRDGRSTLRLDGDFTGGGMYVQAGRQLAPAEPAVISFWIKYPDATGFTLRAIDGTGQCHQFNLKLNNSADWQAVVLPIGEFFAQRGKSGAINGVSKYESWGGAKDSKWHGTAKAIYILVSPVEGKKIRTAWLDDAKLVTAAPPAAAVKANVPLDLVQDGETAWSFAKGDEFPGAKGGLSIEGAGDLKLSGDFTGGGQYVQAATDLSSLGVQDVQAIHLQIKTTNATQMGVRFTDSTKQTHQKPIKLTADGEWHDVVLSPVDIAGGEHWGGKNDGKWHGPPAELSITIGVRSDEANKQPVISLRNATADVTQAAVAQAAAFKRDFESTPAAEWAAKGSVTIDNASAFKGTHALLLDRPADQIEKPCVAIGPAFAVTPGLWDISLAAKSDLQSPDNSFRGVASLELLDGSGTVVRTVTLADQFRQHNWQPVSQRVEVAAGVTQARFKAELFKASGKFWIDELSAAYVSPVARKDNRINRVMFETAQMGNLIFPDDKRTVKVIVETSKPLPEAQRQVTVVVQDYFGAEQIKPIQLPLTKAGRHDLAFVYEATADLSAAPLKIGPYYEIHTDIPQPGDRPFHNYTSFAILPLAVTKQFKPEEIPFTSRTWDNRIKEYLYLSDRLGIRIAGIWGGWSTEPPYEPHAPAIEIAKSLGMGVLTGSPTHMIEQHQKGYEKADDKMLREGVRNWIKQFGDVRPLIIDLGNEPTETDLPRIKEQVAGYKSIYEEVKKIDPSITVLATSVPATEAYFKAGFQNYCDAYDFHVYESPVNVGHAIEAYNAMAKKYDAVKPVCSTEIGLNSQGMARHAVACDMIKKFSVFFAAGGQRVSWFGIMYPDPKGIDFDSSSSAHNVFDCRYAKYAPKLDAISYYNMVNAISIKKFVATKTYDNGVRAFLFRDRDGRSLQVLWSEKGRIDIGLPLAGVEQVQRIDATGDRADLRPAGRAMTVSVSDDPILLLYKKGPETLPEALEAPAATIASLPTAAVRGEAVQIVVKPAAGAAGEMNLVAPPDWIVSKAAQGDAIAFSVTPPDGSNVREGSLAIEMKDGDAVRGQLTVRLPVAGRLALRVVPDCGDGTATAVKLLATNNAQDVQVVTWKVALVNQLEMKDGSYGQTATPAQAYFTGPTEGTATLKPGETAGVLVPMTGVDAQTIYRVKASMSDTSGRTIERERFVAGFASAARVKTPLKLDGTLDDADWAKATPTLINEGRQMNLINKKLGKPWHGPDDLSATVKYLWDDQYLYVGAAVKDDKFSNPKSDGSLWAQDGLQFLFDPAREQKEKPGKYDYSMGLGQKGPQAWCHLSGSSTVPAGEAKDIIVTAKPATDGTGNVTYEIAIPWSRIAPFKPGVGADLGLTLALNEDDGQGRFGFMNWFGDVQSKSVDFNGDVVLRD